jgi:hypothetical protein
VVTFISESDSTRLISHESAFGAVRQALVAAASADANVFPAVIAHASAPRSAFSLKSGSTPELVGLNPPFFLSLARDRQTRHSDKGKTHCRFNADWTAHLSE